MKRKQVESSNIKSVGYDKVRKLLEVEFTSRKIYQYPGVPKKTYEGLMGSESKGSYFYSFIRNAYHGIQVEGDLL